MGYALPKRIISYNGQSVVRGPDTPVICLRSNSYRDPNTDDDSQNSRCPSALLTIESGYRVDPTIHYPIAKVSKVYGLWQITVCSGSKGEGETRNFVRGRMLAYAN